MRFAISGASGFIGSYLTEHLRDAGHEVLRLVRREARSADEIGWNPADGELDPAALAGAEVVVNLSGAGLADKRWSEDYKRVIVDSRIDTTATLARAIAQLDSKPLFVSQSAVGWYGHREPDEELDERSGPGSGFIAAVCRRWEEAADAAREAGARVVHSRCGVILGPGGMLEALAKPAKLGLGGAIGNGAQIVSWLALDDYGPALLHVAAHPELSGPVNFCSPNPQPQAQVAELLAAALHKPTLAGPPAFALRFALGEMAEELLHGQCVMPRRLLDSGYEFRLPCLHDALQRYAPEL